MQITHALFWIAFGISVLAAPLAAWLVSESIKHSILAMIGVVIVVGGGLWWLDGWLQKQKALQDAANQPPPSSIATKPPSPQVPIAKTPKPKPPQPKVKIEQRGNGNGAVGGSINQGPCSVAQVGGNSNQASVNCTPPEPPTRLLTTPQQERLINDLTNAPTAPFWMVIETNDHWQDNKGGLETSDEQGMFAQQLRETLVKAKWQDAMLECYKTTPCSVIAPVYADVADRGVQIMGREHWASAEALGKSLSGRFGMRVVLRPKVESYYENQNNDPRNLHVVLIQVGLQ